AYGTLRSQTVRKEEWAANGDLIMLIEISPGLQGAFYDRLNKLTGGEVQTKLIGK
ncbi:ribosome assembly factor SBDS, partial [Candidatus Micrarchaeota archaeon CG06_land_8_20_14_3_00_50_6]